MTAARLDLIIEKKARFYVELNLVDMNDNPVSLVGKTIEVVIKESLMTETILHHLTETNDGVRVLNDATGKVGLFIGSTATDVEADFGFYTIIRVDPNYPTLDNERLMEGRIIYKKGTI